MESLLLFLHLNRSAQKANSVFSILMNEALIKIVKSYLILTSHYCFSALMQHYT